MVSIARFGKIAGVVLGAAVGLAGAGAVAALRRPLPWTNGTLRAPGLHAPVEVLRDRWGVPHIYAQHNDDLFFAQGYVQAQDRLWQMEFHRRLGHGRLAEIFGPIAVDTDRFIRVLGFSRLVQQDIDRLSGEALAAIRAYVHGVNAFIERHAGRLPVEFTILRYRPEPWQLADVLVWSRIMALGLSENWRAEILRARIVAEVGVERASELDPSYPNGHPLTVPGELRYTPEFGARALEAAAPLGRFFGNGSGQGSNAWVVGPTRSASGRPILADDPHLAIALPSIWYETHLVGGDYEVTGASFPGSPGVVIGHNARIAWGVTNAMIDVQDLYVERFDLHDPVRYEYQGHWEQAAVVHEQINVKGQAEPVVETVRITRHGPVITPIVPLDRSPQPTEELALRWTALGPNRVFDAVLQLNRAYDWDSFRAALASWTVPAQNFVYADVDGHIGYAVGGDVPIRTKGDGRLPVPGWSGEYEWNGVIPNEELPHLLDPADDVVVTANNRIAGDDYPHPLPGEWLNGYRATRVRELIEQSSHHNTDTFARMQIDLRSLPGLELAALAGRLPAEKPTASRAREALATWDGELDALSIGGLIYARLREKLVAAAYAEVAGPLGIEVGLGAFTTQPAALYLHRAAPQVLQRVAMRDDGWLSHGRTWEEVLHTAWQTTLDELCQAYGDDVDAWQYGRWHHLTMRHPLGAAPGLAPLLNRGPFPLGGDADTVNQGDMSREQAGLPVFVAPSYRQICDTANWDRSLSIHASGQSGHPASRQYSDFVRPWRQGDYHPMLWSRWRIEEFTARRLHLLPE